MWKEKGRRMNHIFLQLIKKYGSKKIQQDAIEILNDFIIAIIKQDEKNIIKMMAETEIVIGELSIIYHNWEAVQKKKVARICELNDILEQLEDKNDESSEW